MLFRSLASARVDLLRGQIAFASGVGSDAAPLLLKYLTTFGGLVAVSDQPTLSEFLGNSYCKSGEWW